MSGSQITMAGSQSLLTDLRQLIKCYTDQWRRKRTGDATIAELIVMSCVMSDEPLSLAKVCGWVSRHSVAHGSRDLNAWMELIRSKSMDWLAPIYQSYEHGSERWWSPTNAANSFLRRRLLRLSPPASQIRFRIMDLPTEIRVLIFEFALLLPRSGVWYDFQEPNTTTGAPSRRFKAWTAERDGSLTQYYPSVWKTEKDSPWHDPKFLFQVDLEAHLSLLRASKSIYKEAFPCYYSQNIFFLPNDWAAIKLFRRFSRAQLSQLCHVVWRCSKNQCPSRTLARHLATLPRLRTLVVDLPPMEKALTLSDALQVATIRGLYDVQFFGTIVQYEAFLRPKMLGQHEAIVNATDYGGSTDAV